MRGYARIDRMLALVREIWPAKPDQRLGQLIENARTFSRNNNDQSSAFHVEDSIVEEGLRKWAERIADL